MSLLDRAQRRLEVLRLEQLPCAESAETPPTPAASDDTRCAESAESAERSALPSCACGYWLIAWELARGRCSNCVNREREAAGLPAQVAVWDAETQGYIWRDMPPLVLAEDDQP